MKTFGKIWTTLPEEEKNLAQYTLHTVEWTELRLTTLLQDLVLYLLVWTRWALKTNLRGHP